MALRAALFDLDGTVVENAYDWPRIKAEIGTGGMPILTYLHGLPEPARSRQWAILERHEAEQTEGDVVLKRVLRKQSDDLVSSRQPKMGALVGLQFCDVPSEQFDLPGTRHYFASDLVKQRGLAGTIRPEKQPPFPGTNLH